jgi:hypothetical protein
MADDARYLDAEIVEGSPAIAVGSSFADSSGLVNISEGEAEYIWVLGVVYDLNGQVLGLRRWEAEVPLATNNSFPFEFRVFSMQGEIVAIKLFVEAHASIP